MKLPFLLIAILSLQINLFANTIDVTADISTNTTWVSSNQYILKDYIFVTPGASLTIEAGTVIKAEQASGDSAPCLIVTQGAQIYAIGTKDNPIVFTSVSDNGTNLTKDNKGLWGGLLILGNAPINSNGSNADNSPLTSTIEGVPTTSGISGRSIPASYSQFGGTDSNDNSGTLQYLSIRHGGAEIGSGNEINGLTLGAVGAGTTMDHIEIYASKDDGIEIYGGSVNAKYVSVAYVGDDSFDIDEGYNGHLQFLLSIQDEDSNRAIEWDGSTESDDRRADTSTLPDWSNPMIANMTAIGIGKDGTSSHEDNNIGLEIRDNAGGQVWNSIFTEFAKSIMDVEKTDSVKGTQSTTDPSVYGSQALIQNGILVFKGNLFYNGGHSDGNTALGTAEGDSITATQLSASGNNNSFDVDPKLVDWDDADGNINPFPGTDSPALSGAEPLTDTTFLSQVSFRGAFASDNWLEGWSQIHNSGVIGTPPPPPLPPTGVVFVDENIGSNITWTANNTYILRNLIFIEPGNTLVVEEGTLIKAESGPTGLVVTQGAEIIADGSEEHPIIFTSVEDDINNIDGYTERTLDKNDKGLWGGLIIMGKAPINSNYDLVNSNPMIDYDYYIPVVNGKTGETIPESYRQFGGADASDTSGILDNLSVRHGGIEGQDGEHSGGISLQGVGYGTKIQETEIFASDDDGFKIKGGTFNASRLAVFYPGDDSFDFDQGYNGQLQFLLSIHDENSNRALEIDGVRESGDKGIIQNGSLEWSNVQISNMTAIGIGKDGTSIHPDNNVGMEIRDNAGGQVWNSIFMEFPKSIIDIENTPGSEKGTVNNQTGSRGSQALLEMGHLSFHGNLFYNGGRGNTANGTVEDDPMAADVIFNPAFENSYDLDPKLSSANGIITPFPSADSPALRGEMTDSNGRGFFQDVGFRGAFAFGENWLEDWSVIDQKNIIEQPEPGKVTNIQAQQIPGTLQVEISFDLEIPANMKGNIEDVFFSEDGGSNYIHRCNYLSGPMHDLHSGRQVIVWDAGEDWPNRETPQGRIKIVIEVN